MKQSPSGATTAIPADGMGRPQHALATILTKQVELQPVHGHGLSSEGPQREEMGGKRHKDPSIKPWLLAGKSLAGPWLAPWTSGHPPQESKSIFDPKPVKVSGRVPINFREMWVSAKNDYCQEQILFSNGICNTRKQNNRSFVFHFLSFLTTQPLLD